MSPSHYNNIVGIKPTVGLTSRYLVVPISEHQDTVGPMARTVRDAAKLLQVIAGADPNDNYTSASPFKNGYPDYLAACKSSGLRGKRIGIARNVIDDILNSTQTLEEFESAISVMASAGATIVENTNFTAYGQLKARKFFVVAGADFISDFPQYLSKLEQNPQHIHNLEDLRNFARSFPEEDYPTHNTEVWDLVIQRNISNTSPDFWPAYQENLYLGGEGGILGALERHSLDAIVLPTSLAPQIPALVGAPIINVPLGAASNDTPVQKDPFWDVVEDGPGFPFGISFLGARWSEETLIEIAYAFEQKTLVRDTLGRHIMPRIDLADVIAR